METLEPSGPPDERPGTPSQWGCPDCGGVLWHIEDAHVLRFRCRVGHAWAAESLARRQDEDIETALWAALRSLEDRAALARRMAEQADRTSRGHSANRWHAEAAEIGKSAAVLRQLLEAVEQDAGTGTGG
jgi:two-component system chemotaxis response regulator CheB